MTLFYNTKKFSVPRMRNGITGKGLGMSCEAREWRGLNLTFKLLRTSQRVRVRWPGLWSRFENSLTITTTKLALVRNQKLAKFWVRYYEEHQNITAHGYLCLKGESVTMPPDGNCWRPTAKQKDKFSLEGDIVFPNSKPTSFPNLQF